MNLQTSSSGSLGLWRRWAALGLVLFGVVSCKTTYNANRVDPEEAAQEGSLVFVRPDRYTVLGTRSVRDYVEIAYERDQRNAADLLVVQAGFRNRGGQRWYDRRGPDFTLSVKTAFYEESVTSELTGSVPVYETPWSPLPLARGDTFSYQVTCPVPTARGYRITVSEFLEHKDKRR